MLLLIASALGCNLLAPTPTPPPAPAVATPRVLATPGSAEWWRPTPGLTWQWQLEGEQIDTSIEADVYDIDLYADQAIIDRLHAQGRRVICYISVGSWEEWRPDEKQFPRQVIGKAYQGWAGEKWLDIRQIELLAPIMSARLDLCQAKGFDGVEPDNMDVLDNETGFPISYQDQLAYARWLAEQAHARGLAIGQKNAASQTQELVDLFDFAILEDAFYYDWAVELLPYTQAGKAVLAAEYTDLDGDFEAACRQAQAWGFSAILKRRQLDAWRETCP